MLSSPTISHDDEDQQSDGPLAASSEKGQDTEEDEKEDENETTEEEDEEQEEGEVKEVAVVEVKPVVVKPLNVMYQKRDILDLSTNLIGRGQFVQYTVLPDNNVNCFFQNRAQYWRLSSGERQEYSHEKCSCCDFTYPSSQQHLNQGPMANNKNVNANAVTDSLLTFLKNSENMTAMPNNVNKRPMSCNSQFGYPMQHQQPPQPPQQYQPPSNGFYNNNNSSNSFNASFNQPMNPFMNNGGGGGGYGTTLALLNLMNNASRTAASAFQAMSNTNTTPRYYNNMNNNGYGLYKQF